MANKVVLVDANIFLAYENIRDTHHTRALELFQKIQIGIYGTWFITDYIFNEVVGVTFRKFGKERAIAVGESMLKSMILLNIEKNHAFEHTLAHSNSSFFSKLSKRDANNFIKNIISDKPRTVDSYLYFLEEL